jgi:hypothetical protein
MNKDITETKQSKCIYQSMFWPPPIMHCCCCSGCGDLDDDPDPIITRRNNFYMILFALFFGYIIMHEIREIFN